MDQKNSAHDIFGAVEDIGLKLNSKQEITIKTPSNPITQGFLLSKIMVAKTIKDAPIFVFPKDEFAKLNLIKSLKHWETPLNQGLSCKTASAILNEENKIIILTKEESCEKIPTKEEFEKATISVKTGQKISIEKLFEKISSIGYKTERSVYEKGAMAKRGSVIDVFACDKKNPIRIDFDDDKIESIKTFSIKDGKILTNEKEQKIIPNNFDFAEKKSTIKEYSYKAKFLQMEPFPSNYDFAIGFGQTEIQKFTKEVLENEAKDLKHKLPSFIKNLSKGDFVVHIDHGIAKFDGIVEQAVGKITREYFKLCYAQQDVLFLPVTSAEKMEKYIGDPNPQLNRLSNGGWGKSLSRASIDTLRHARELLNTQAKRHLSDATAIPRDKKIEKKLEETFPYKETEDQKKVIETIYDDLSKSVPMDRLVCGDVGFGKTEVAIRAAAKAALEGFQVAVLSPTTILAQQHIDTFTERLKDFPINIKSLSRFETKEAQKETIKKIEQGKVDIVIGTHRILSDDIKFKNLGLIIIDEEQKFGVSHKEKLKKIRAEAHVLTLTATPIPRTLHLAISGVRPISNITTPPGGRKAIHTIIEPYNQKHVASAIQEEIKRRGQVYYLYNKVETMHAKMQELKEYLPKIRIDMLHGQMPENQMARIMHDFDKRKIDLLVCSTIIENGLDLPNVNTLIVDNAVSFGLAQLYQIRGRIGRGSRQAYSYFFFRRQKLTGEAEKRLNALECASELGSGFDLAQADMEIRGVGNVLGKAQHGHVKSIGLGLYLRLLNNAVEEIKSGTPSLMLSDITVDLPIESRIPQSFEPDKQKRIELYHKLALVDDEDDLENAKVEIQKQGAIPLVVENLFYVLKLKILGRKAGISSIDTAFASISSQEQTIMLKTENPIGPKIFARLLETSDKWEYSQEAIKILKKDLGTDWMKKLEQCVKKLRD